MNEYIDVVSDATSRRLFCFLVMFVTITAFMMNVMMVAANVHAGEFELGS